MINYFINLNLYFLNYLMNKFNQKLKIIFKFGIIVILVH